MRPPSTSEHAFPDVLALFEVLVRHRADFVVVGGVAVAFHGFSRATRDLDLVPEPSSGNIGKLWAALDELEAAPADLPGLRARELRVSFSHASLSSGGSWELETKHGLLHVLQYIAGKVEDADDYTRLRERAEPSRYDFGTVWFVRYEDLIDLTYLAGREQDLTDIRALEEARRSAGPENERIDHTDGKGRETRPFPVDRQAGSPALIALVSCC